MVNPALKSEPIRDPAADVPLAARPPLPAHLRLRNVVIVLGLAVLVWATFGQASYFDWVRYDDGDYVYRCAPVSSELSARSALWAFTHFHAHNWHPLTTVSHMLDCQLFGVRPQPAHIVNVLIHLLATVALFFALESLTGSFWRSAMVAAVFAIHPLRAESVAWIAERKDVLSGLFFMLTIWAWSAYARRGSMGRYLVALLLGLLGLLSKPMLVTLPFVLLLVDYWPLRRFERSSLTRLLLEKVPFLCGAAVSAIATIRAQTDAIGSQLPLVLRLENALVSYIIYLGQFLWPVHLAVIYPHPRTWLPAPVLLGCGLLFAAISAIAFFARKTLPFLFTGWFWFVGMLVPVIGIIQVGSQAHADRYTYLPLIGITIAVVWVTAAVLARIRRRLVIGVAAAVLVLMPLAILAHRQVGYWRNPDTLWPHTLALTRDNDAAESAFASALLAEGRTDEANSHMREAIRINPANAGRFGGVPLADAEQDIDGGLSLWSERVRQNPNDVAARDNLGVLLVQKHQPRAAIEQWEAVLALAPGDGNAQNNLAWVLATAPDDSLRDGTRALALATATLRLGGDANPLLLRTFAAACAEAGRFDEASAAAERGRELAEREGNRSLAAELDSQLASYRAHRPLRDPSLQWIDR